TFDPTHPIMWGVARATGDLLGQVSVAQGAQLVASWANGLPCVATRGARVAALNLFFGGSGHWTGDASLILHNAALWTSGVPAFVRGGPGAGPIPPGGSAPIQVAFDAAHLGGGDYRADVVVQGNAPDQPEAVVQASLHVTPAPDIVVVPASLEFGNVFVGGAR